MILVGYHTKNHVRYAVYADRERNVKIEVQGMRAGKWEKFGELEVLYNDTHRLEDVRWRSEELADMIEEVWKNPNFDFIRRFI